MAHSRINERTGKVTQGGLSEANLEVTSTFGTDATWLIMVRSKVKIHRAFSCFFYLETAKYTIPGLKWTKTLPKVQ